MEWYTVFWLVIFAYFVVEGALDWLFGGQIRREPLETASDYRYIDEVDYEYIAELERELGIGEQEEDEDLT